MTSTPSRLRIAYINQDFPPEVGAGPARVLELALSWQKAGAEVTVITGMPNRRMPGRPDGAVHPDYRGRAFMEEDWQGLRVLRSWLYASPERGVARTMANNASFMVTGALHALARGGRFDVAIASSPPFLAHVTGELMRRVKRVPLVLEVRDLWPDYLVEMGVFEGRWSQKMLFGLERYLLGRADHVVVVTERFRARMAEKGVPPDAVSVIPNGVDLDRYHPDTAPSPLPALAHQDGEFLVGYLGNFGAGQDLRTVIEAAALVEGAAPDVRFVLVGDGKEKPLVEASARERGLKNLSIHPPIERSDTRAFYNACDLCLVPLAPLPILRNTVPSKLFEILACERPVLGSVAGEAAGLLRDSGAGWVTAPGDAAAMARGILRARELSAGERAQVGSRGRRYVAEHFGRDRLASRYLEILKQVARA